ncbi:TlpA disulfide reductase family protein [Sphingobacterium multivorum]|uniref:TlpA disulfide reductase family protein n=2 Tax=Sphingobacterium multivorum TaxID=28454 RepID=UPI0028ACA200|nr:TlpA disulfide reductase family protein [Sphingobacterium multivorum]
MIKLYKQASLQFRRALLLLLLPATLGAQAQVSILPEKAAAGDTVTISFDPVKSTAAPGAGPFFVDFNYSNFYEFPSRMPMQREGGLWRVRFKLPPYANFSCFTIADKDKKFVQRASDSSQYEIYVYKQGKLIAGNYLGKSYSIPVQDKTSDRIVEKQEYYLKKELSLYPDNYEAQLRLIVLEMKKSNPAQQARLLKKGLAVVEKKFRSNPLFEGNLNKVTMGYLILGQNQKVDSIRQVVIKEFPNKKIGIAYRLNKLFSEPDSTAVVAKIGQLLALKTADNEAAYGSAYDYLFTYYVRHGDSVQAKKYLPLITRWEQDPYKWRAYNQYVQLLLDHKLLLNDASKLNLYLLDSVAAYPVSLIRYFPETGYLVAHDPAKADKIAAVKAELMANQGLIAAQLNQTEVAQDWFAKSIPTLESAALLRTIALQYQAWNEPERAIPVLEAAYRYAPFDPQIRQLLDSALNKKGMGDAAERQAYFRQLDKQWKQGYYAEFQKIIGSTPLPEDLSIVDMDKKPLLKAELAGKIVVIDFWATWCKPCIASFPYLHQVYKKYADDPQVKFVVLNSGSGNSWDDAYKWAQANPEFDFPFYYNQDKKLSSKLEITSIPTTLILDKKGNIRFRKVGFEGEKLLQSLDAMIEYLKELDQ